MTGAGSSGTTASPVFSSPPRMSWLCLRNRWNEASNIDESRREVGLEARDNAIEKMSRIRFEFRLSSQAAIIAPHTAVTRSEEHTSELQSLMRISYAVFC